MSIADGQLVLQAPPQSEQQQASEASWQRLTGSNVDASTSVSRIGSRAYPAAMAGLAPSIRFDLAQAADAVKFASDRVPTALQQQQLQRAALLQAALAQQPRQPVPVEEQVCFAGSTFCICVCIGVRRNTLYCMHSSAKQEQRLSECVLATQAVSVS